MLFTITKRKVKYLVINCILVFCIYQLLLHIFIAFFQNNLNETKPIVEETAGNKVPTDSPGEYVFFNEEETYGTQENLAENVKFILLVTSATSHKYPFSLFGEDNSVFVENDCNFTNCYISYNKSHLSEESFDMIAFNLPELDEIDIPEKRSPHQKYAFFSMESSQYNPVCIDMYDDFFNWTFTYKLNSDFRLWFFDIYNINETKIGPPVNIWPTFDPIDDDIKMMLDGKTKIAAWFVSNCNTRSGREKIAQQLDKELKNRYGWSIDIYGHCGKFACPRRYAEICNKKIEEQYFFYLAFENSFADDYVTEKVLLAVNNYAVPIVFGGANYSRFLPPDSYLNIRELGVSEVARLMHKAYIHREFYYDYFKWTNYLYYRHISRRSQISGIGGIMKVGTTSVHLLKNFSTSKYNFM
ncbi:alpha-(1,3)-fucosyltransferase C-like isoform X2 [Pieris brassicae]|uniref:alpha-(1,3)-fucosyltransferase C-like isoform X2 n=1 Tax=Pieris brassicae TaxID=7116 RepID=UPI001E660A8F|nr:alpha-(1,3)-fucosyltransferase C-like isoform X2 [Pieris brassicae]